MVAQPVEEGNRIVTGRLLFVPIDVWRPYSLGAAHWLTNFIAKGCLGY